MKELYISPELEILCFAPAEGIASNFGTTFGDGALTWSARSGNSDGISTGEGYEGDVTTPVGGQDPLN